MASRAHILAKGREGEHGVAAYLRKHGWPHAERRRQAGAKDRGDIGGVLGVTIEAKNANRVDLADWMNELAVEMVNTGDAMGFAVAKRRGYPFRLNDPSTIENVGEWYAVMPFRLMVQLLKEAGYQ